MPRGGRRSHLCIDDYDCIGFDLDHTLCRYNVGPMVRLEYDLLADFLVNKKGYDPAIRERSFERDRDLVCKGLTLDCERGNLLRLAADGFILGACHGTRRMSDSDVEREYGRCRKRHPGPGYTQHLAEHGPQGMVDFGQLLHSFMDYFDMAAPLLCARIVDVVDEINNGGRPMAEYFFWPDVQEGLKHMFIRTNFATDRGGYFPEVKAHPEKYILRRGPRFREWLQMLRANGKYLYVITGSHFDFASHVASYALGEDWKDLFDIVIFFARKPSFFSEKRPFWRLDGAREVESFEGWEDLETGEYYSQGNWKDLNEFFEYCTEWEPSASLYFGDNVLQDVLAPKKFTTTVDSVAVCEDLLAEGMVDRPPTHPDADDITSKAWGSYFFFPDPRVVWKKDSVMSRASSFKSRMRSAAAAAATPATPASATASGASPESLVATAALSPPPPPPPPSSSSSSQQQQQQQREEEMKKALSLRRAVTVSTMQQLQQQQKDSDSPPSSSSLLPLNARQQQLPLHSRLGTLTPRSSLDRGSRSGTPAQAPREDAGGKGTPTEQQQQQECSELPTGVARVNTLWGALIRDYAKMCIPDLEALVDYPIDYKFPAFGKNKQGVVVTSGFFPADPVSLHTRIPVYGSPAGQQQ